MSDICDKLNFTTNYTYFMTTDIFVSKNTHIILFDTCDLDGFIAEPRALFGSLEGNEME